MKPEENASSGSEKPDPAALSLWRRRWGLVMEIEREELRRLTPAEKFRQLENLFADARHFGWLKTSGHDASGSRAAWAKLREVWRD